MRFMFMLAVLLASSALDAQSINAQSINARGDGPSPLPEGEKVCKAVSQLPYAAEGS